MAAAFLPLTVEQGAYFSRTLLFGTGVIFCTNSFTDMAGDRIRVGAIGHIFEAGDRVKVVAIDTERRINYAGSFIIADVVPKVSFSIQAAWQGSIQGTAQKSLDLTGLGWRAVGKETYSSPETIVDFVSQIVDTLGGVATMTLDADVTEGYTPIEDAVWTGELYNLTNPADVSRGLQGPLEITAEA